MSALELVEQIISRVKLTGNVEILARTIEGEDFRLNAACIGVDPLTGYPAVVLRGVKVRN